MYEENQLQLSDFDVLDKVEERSPCQQCRGVSRRYFCYTCVRPMPILIDRLPRVRLPVNIDIVRHPKEKHGKSTGVQCAILAPENVRLFVFPDFPDYRLENAILIFPDPSTITLSQVIDRRPIDISDADRSIDINRLEAFDRRIREATRFVFIDCTWFQVGGMRRHEHFQSVATLALDGRRTRYWRPQHNEPDGNLSTVEAVYYFCLDYRNWINRGRDYSYDGCYDNLLYFFEYFRRKVEAEKMARIERQNLNLNSNLKK